VVAELLIPKAIALHLLSWKWERGRSCSIVAQKWMRGCGRSVCLGVVEGWVVRDCLFAVVACSERRRMNVVAQRANVHCLDTALLRSLLAAYWTTFGLNVVKDTRFGVRVTFILRVSKLLDVYQPTHSISFLQTTSNIHQVYYLSVQLCTACQLLKAQCSD
jgi:hypothetical protein